MKEFAWPVIAGLALGMLYMDRFAGADRVDVPATAPTVVPDASVPGLPGMAAPVLSYAQAVERAMPAVVNIYTKKIVRPNPMLQNPFMRGFEGQPRMEGALGSGVIAHEKGYVLTNLHVISDADEILVALNDGRESVATIVGVDRETDLAVLKIELPDLHVIEFGDPQRSHIGDVVLAIGNPLGVGQTVTQGIISAAARYGLELNIQENYLQTDAAINQGNSGGALVDARGYLLGINTAIQSPTGTSIGIGYAIPSDTAQKVLSDIVQYGYVIRGWIGIESMGLTSYGAALVGLPNGQGIVVSAVYRNGPADKAGLQGGDIITHLNDAPAFATRSGFKHITHAQPGDKLKVRYLRGRRPYTTEIIIGVKPAK